MNARPGRRSQEVKSTGEVIRSSPRGTCRGGTAPVRGLWRSR